MTRRLLFLALVIICTVPALADAYIGVGGGISQWEVVPGDVVELFIGAFNQGPDVAQGVVITIGVLPGAIHELTELPAGWTCNMAGDPITCSTPAMAVTPGSEQAVFRFRVTVGTGAFGQQLLPLAISAANAQRQETVVQWDIVDVTIVTTTADSGSGSLRAAIEDVNASCAGVSSHCRIEFDLHAPAVIEPLTPLPPITACGLVHLDGAPGSPLGDRPVELSGAKVTAGPGLHVRPQCADGSRMVWIDDLAVNRFPEDGVRIEPMVGTYEVRMNGMYIGTDPTGTIARPNGSRGVAIISPLARVSIGDSIVSGNARSGIWAWDCHSVSVGFCKIGVGADGRPLGNGATGIFIRRGLLQGYSNTVAYNAQWGISAYPGAHMATVYEHSIHSNGALGYDWGVDFLTLEEGPTHPAAPVITSATYDETTGRTTVRGTLHVEKPMGTFYTVHVFSNASLNAHGFVEGERWEWSGEIGKIEAGTTAEWTVVVRDKDLRGRILSAVSAASIDIEFPASNASEFSLPFTMR